MTAAFRVLVAFCVLASTGAFAACVGDDDNADPKAERAERQRTEAPDGGRRKRIGPPRLGARGFGTRPRPTTT